MVIGWETIDGKKYFFKSSGEMATNWRELYGHWYFFDETDGYMKTNSWIIKNQESKFYVDDSGHMVIGWKEIGDKWYYFDEDGKMATGEREILGRTYDFKPDGSKAGTFPPLYIIYDFYFSVTEDKTALWENMDRAIQLMYLHQLYHGFISEKQKEYVSKKAILGCTYGTKLTRLDATKAADISYLTDGSPVLGCDDCKAGENIHSFLSCRAGVEGCRGMPYREKMKDGFQKCIPMVEESWKQDNDNTPRICRDNGYAYEYALKKDAILVCKYKGIIGILEVMEDEIQGERDVFSDWAKTNRSEKVKFLQPFVQLAKNEELRTGVPWQVTLGQIAYETGWGDEDKKIYDEYTKMYSYNLFGVKYTGAVSGITKYVRTWTTEYINSSDLNKWKKEHDKWALNNEPLVNEGTLNGNLKIRLFSHLSVIVHMKIVLLIIRMYLKIKNIYLLIVINIIHLFIYQ